MNITAVIIILVVFFIMSEILTHMYHKYNTFVRCYISFMRILVFSLSIMTIIIDNNTYTFLENEYDFNKNLIVHQDSLINYQRTMMDDLANHLWEDHDCDIPQYDGDLKFLIDYETEIVDSLHNIKE